MVKPQKGLSEIHHLSGLNGIRAIAALAVVFSHTTLALNKFGLDPRIFGTLEDGSPQGLSLAGFGVSIFFALSGFLITYLLCLESNQQKVDIKKFYIRRALRIWPLYYLYLIVVIVIILLSNESINFKSLGYYIFFAANVPFIINTAIPLLSHYWSLGVEEQFYLIWPWYMKAKIKARIWVIILFVALMISIKVFLHFFHPNSILELVIHVGRFHCMLIGSAGAILYFNDIRWFITIVDNKIVQSFAWIIICLVAINKFHIASVIDNELITMVGLVIIVGQVNVGNRLINLEVKPLNFVGKISYGIYVIHPALIFLLSKNSIFLFHDGRIENYLIVYCTVLAITILTSYLSYITFERFFLKLKDNFQIVRTSN